MMNVILTPFAVLLRFLYELSGSYGGAIILFCLATKVILLPISMMGRKGMLAMSSLADEQKQIQQKYIHNKQKYSEELAALYARENVKPSSGCVWSMLPMPILFGLYAIIRQPLTYLMKLTADQVSEVSAFLFPAGLSGGNPELTMAQTLYERFGAVQAALPGIGEKIFPMDFTFLGINLSGTPDLFFFKQPDAMSWANIGLFLIPIVSAILGYLSMKASNFATSKVLGKQTIQDTSMKSMSLMMPLMSLWICFTMPAGLGIYWIANNVFSILQELCTIGWLKKYVAKKQEGKELRIEQDKERVREQKKKAAALKTQAAEENRRLQLERKMHGGSAADSRVGIRAYAKGRTYMIDRYETSEYRDPNEVVAAQIAERERVKAEQIEKKAVSKKKKKAESETPEDKGGKNL
ncbi:MAG: YidC/Oxa1 family membrane protein insertase [Evtepia sp.]